MMGGYSGRAVVLSAAAGIIAGFGIALLIANALAYRPSAEFFQEIAALEVELELAGDSIEAEVAAVEEADARVEQLEREGDAIADDLEEAREEADASAARAEEIGVARIGRPVTVEDLEEENAALREALRDRELECGICQDFAAQRDSTITALRIAVLEREEELRLLRGENVTLTRQRDRYREELEDAQRGSPWTGRAIVGLITLIGGLLAG